MLLGIRLSRSGLIFSVLKSDSVYKKNGRCHFLLACFAVNAFESTRDKKTPRLDRERFIGWEMFCPAYGFFHLFQLTV